MEEVHVSETQNLYEWFDGEVTAQMRERERYAACTAVNHSLGVLVGLGHSVQEIQDFVDRVLRVTEVLMTRISDGNTLGQNLDAMFASPALVCLDGGNGKKETT